MIVRESLPGRPPIRFGRRQAALLLRLALVLVGLQACRPAAEPEIRHLVVVCIDTLRADHVGSWGYARPTTPNIDALADRGVRFLDTMATSNWTVPSVASILTSLSPFRHGAGLAGETRRLSEENVPVQVVPTVPMLAQHLARLGYSSALLSANPFLYGRFKDGFETSEVERVDATRLTDRALEWLDRTDDRSRFLYLQYMDVHQPNNPPMPYFQFFPSSDGEMHQTRHGDWSFGRVENLDDPEFLKFREHRIALYDGALRFVDSEIGRLLRKLDEPPYRDSTLIVVTSDHGEEFWDHALEQSAWKDDPRGIWGVGHGHSMYREQLHVPLVVSGGPFARLAGRQEPCAASLLDVAPTLLAAAALPAMDHAEGRDLWSLTLQASRGSCESRARLASSPAYGPDSQALLHSRWKLIETVGRPALLFDVRADPLEKRDEAGGDPVVREAMRGGLAKLRTQRSQGVTAPDNALLADELRALGYI